MAKERLDILLVERGHFQSREKARASIMSGVVYVNQIKEDKPGSKFDEDSIIEVRGNLNPFVSRGGLKLDKAVKIYNIVLENKIAMDIGASTGGFTDCMLKNGAKRVYAVDVGYGQLAWSLRNDDRVVNMERTNIRYVKPEDVSDKIDFASIDVSFISLSKVLPPAKELLSEEGEILCLIKPQFEAGREKVGKHGVVRDIEVHRDVAVKIALFAVFLGFGVIGITYSPIKGPEGNIEYLLYISLMAGTKNDEIICNMVNEAVDKSHTEL